MFSDFTFYESMFGSLLQWLLCHVLL